MEGAFGIAIRVGPGRFARGGLYVVGLKGFGAWAVAIWRTLVFGAPERIAACTWETGVEEPW
jgi:hypothetical protein